MTDKERKEMRELDEIADRAGGYVMPPWDMQPNPEGEREFTLMRQYALAHNIPMSKLAPEDYAKMGLRAPVA